MKTELVLTVGDTVSSLHIVPLCFLSSAHSTHAPLDVIIALVFGGHDCLKRGAPLLKREFGGVLWRECHIVLELLQLLGRDDTSLVAETLHASLETVSTESSPCT